MSTAAVIDEATFRQLEESAGKEFVAELARTFLEEAPRMIEQIRDALAKGDTERFRRAAHSLKSNSQTFGATELAKRARELELSAAEKVAKGDAGALGSLAQEYDRAAIALKERIGA
jgi:HPt (histidine-containing phosphotransfer) domain-containing protein